MYEARIEKDSLSPDGVRLTTFVVTFPRIVLAEFNTHRMFSRNSASSRAIPVEKRIKMIEADPFIPEQFGKNQKGMQADEVLADDDSWRAASVWRNARDLACASAEVLAGLGVHKQLANRLLEPFCWNTVVVTATEWDNFFSLRCHKNAQPEIQKIALMMLELYVAGKPEQLQYGQWHLPFIYEEDEYTFSDQDPAALPRAEIKMASAGRCARVSYLTHDGKRDPAKDVELAQSLLKNGHMSPFEHIARPMTKDEISDYALMSGLNGGEDHIIPLCANFRGWVQMRKELPGEAVWKETEE